MRQFRFVHVGVAAALAAAAVSALGLFREVGAAGDGASSFVPIVPCRLVDTRTGADNVGPRSTPLREAESVTFSVWGTNGNCTIPSTATGIATNVTAVNPTAASYVTVFPADANPRPTASNLNVVADSPPTPNQVTVGLSAAGAIGVYNNGGTLDLVIDIVGFYQPDDTGGTGPQGPPGPPGPGGGTLVLNGLDLVTQVEWSADDAYAGCVGFGANALAPSYVPIDLPSGAMITSVTIRYVDDNAPAKLSVTLYRNDRAGSGSAVSAQAVSIDGSSAMTLSLLPHPAVSPTLGYTLVLISTSDANHSVSYCGAEVTYTVA